MDHAWKVCHGCCQYIPDWTPQVMRSATACDLTLGIRAVPPSVLESAVQEVADGRHDARPDWVGAAAQVGRQQRHVGGNRPRHPAAQPTPQLMQHAVQRRCGAGKTSHVPPFQRLPNRKDACLQHGFTTGSKRAST